MRALRPTSPRPRLISQRFATSLVATWIVCSSAACSDNLTLPPDRPPYEDPMAEPLACVPNLDGVLDRSEIEAAIGIPIRYLVAPAGVDRPVDLNGASDGEGAFSWDFSADYADDQEQTVVPTLASEKWYADSFPADAFVTPFEGGLEQVGRIDDNGLYLLGLASKDPEPMQNRTLLVYSSPVTLLNFPVQVGQSLVSTGDVQNGTVLGLPYAGRDIYEIQVDSVGSIDLPAFTFQQVHKVSIRTTVEPAVGSPTTQRQVSFYAECFAEVVRATSALEEPEASFTTATNLRRLGFQFDATPPQSP